MEKLTPQKVQQMLRDKGTELTLEQAAAVLAFIQKMANTAVSNYLNPQPENDNHD